MKTYTFKVEQNGGEYYGVVKIKSSSDNYEIKNHRIVVLDDVEIEFDEYIQLISIKE